MGSKDNPQLTLAASTIAIVFSTFAVFGGSLTLIGWWLNVVRLTDWLNDGISMFVNPAICVALLGLGLQLMLVRTPMAICGVRILSMAVFAIASATLVEHCLDINLGIDTALLQREWGQFPGNRPMRMGLPAATSLFLLSFGLLLLTRSSEFKRIGVYLANGTLVLCIVSQVGFLYGADPLYAIASITSIARQTSFLLICISIAMIALVPEHALHRVLTRTDAGSALFRRLGFPALLIPFSLGLLKARGETAGYFDGAFADALQAIGETVTFLLVLAYTTHRITKQSRLLEKSEKRLALIVGHSVDAIISIDTQGFIRSWNAGATQLLGYSEKEAIGMPLHVLIAPAQLAEEKAVIENILAGQSVKARETQRLTKDGRSIDVSITSSPLIDDDRIIGISKIIHDISDRVRAEKVSQQISRNKDEFLATLAHELRNPMAPVVTALTLLEDPGLSHDKHEEFRMLAVRHMNHLIRLVDDLLDISRISLGKVVLKENHCVFQDAIRQAIESVESVRLEMNHCIEVNLCEEPIVVYGDFARLTQIVTNLIHNAIKYTLQNGLIQVSLKADSTEGILKIGDNGIGIAPEHIRTIFELFTQVKHGSEDSQGLGIGLSLVKHLVELHHGRIEIHSAGAGKGTCVTVVIPRIERHLLPKQEYPVETSVNESEPAMQQGDSRSRRILVVDDLRAITLTLSALLNRLGHDVQVANSGFAALNLIDNFHPELIISDVSMPEMDGYELATEIRNRWGSSIRLVALTGHGSESDRAKTKESGFDAHLVKPVSLERLVQCLDSIKFD